MYVYKIVWPLSVRQPPIFKAHATPSYRVEKTYADAQDILISIVSILASYHSTDETSKTYVARRTKDFLIIPFSIKAKSLMMVAA